MIGNKLEPFKFWCQKVLPNVYDDSLSYYEYLCKLNEYLNEVIEQINTLTDNMEDYESDLSAQWTAYKNALNAEWAETKNYIDNYFNNLDVQQEINNKLDQMAQSGALSTLLAPIVGTQIGGVVADQIDATVANQIGATVASQIDASVARQIDEPTATAVSAWLNAHVNPVGSAVTVDNTLSISGSAADAKVTGDRLRAIENGTTDSEITSTNGDHYSDYIFCNGREYKFTNNTNDIVNLRLVDSNNVSTTLISSLASGATFTFVCDGVDYVGYKTYWAGSGSTKLEISDSGVFDYIKDNVNTVKNELDSFTQNFIKKIASSSDFNVTGYLKADGTISVTSGWLTTDYIEIPDYNMVVNFNGVCGETANELPTFCLYDANHTLIQAIHATFENNTFSDSVNVEHAKYIRITTNTTLASSSYVNSKTLIPEIENTIEIANNLKSSVLKRKEVNYTSYNFSTNPVSSTWYGIGSTVIVPNNIQYAKMFFKLSTNATVLIEVKNNNKLLISKSLPLTSGENSVIVPLVDADANSEVELLVSTANSGILHQTINVVATQYAVTAKCKAKNAGGWGTYDNTAFSVPVYFYAVIPEYTPDNDILLSINAHDTIPTIYMSQFSDDISKSPTSQIYVDSVIRNKQNVKFNGLDRLYLPVKNTSVQSSNIVTTQVNATLSGNGYEDKDYTFNVLSMKTSALNNKTAVVLQIGDSVTAGAGSQFNTDDKPNTSWAYMAYLGKKYLQNYLQVGYNSSEEIELYGGGTYTAKAEGIGGWNLYDFLYSSEKEVSGIVTPNRFYDSTKIWNTPELNLAGVKFSLAKYIETTGITTPTHVVIQLGFNDSLGNDFITNMGYIIKAIHEEYPSIIIGLSLLRDYGMFFEEDYPRIAPNESAYHGTLYNKTQSWIEAYMALEDTENSVYYIPTFFVSPTGDSIPTYNIDDINVAFRADYGYHPNHKAHVEWGKQMFAWLAYTLLS